MRTSMRLFCAAVLLAPLAFAGSDPCVPEGGSIDVNFTNPDISGFGAGASITGAEGFEADPGSDDSLGSSSFSGGSASVNVSNDGDNLHAGDEVGDGATGEDCFEIYMQWTVRYYTTETTTVEVSSGPFGITKTAVEIVEHTATIRSRVKVVCPC